MKTKLKPCPFCRGFGRKEQCHLQDGSIIHWCKCTGCQCQTQTFNSMSLKGAAEKAVEAWNRRTP